jgi:AraC-like DNA-binding protein
VRLRKPGTSPGRKPRDKPSDWQESARPREHSPAYTSRREGGSGLFRIFGDGKHQSRHVREHAEQVRAYLEANLTQDLDMNAVARAASLSPFYLTRIFKQRYGVPPYRYLIGFRIRYASDLLRESSLSVTQVCHRSGFNSLSHFIRPSATTPA